jgi:hypothetical protein
MSNSNRSAQKSTGQQPRVLNIRPLTTREVTDKMVKMVESGEIMTERIYVNDDVLPNDVRPNDVRPYDVRPNDVRPNPLSQQPRNSSWDKNLSSPPLRPRKSPSSNSNQGKLPPIGKVPDITPPIELRGGKYSKNVYKKVGKKEVLGKDRVIYKMKGSNKEYLKTKGMYIPVSEYKKLKK